MTSKEYYKQTSDMAFAIDDWTFLGDTVEAVVKLRSDGAKGEKLHEDILKNNDFFAIKDYKKKTKWDVDVSLPVLEINFFYEDIQKHYVYELSVCDAIDCTIGSGEMVLSCEGYELIDEYSDVNEPVPDDYDDDDEDEIEEDGETEPEESNKGVHSKGLVPKFPPFFDDDMFKLSRFNPFNMTNTFSDFEKHFDEMKKSGTKFYEECYTMDGNGNGRYRKVDNDGVIEKRFKRVDGNVEWIKDDKKPEVEAKNPSDKVSLKDLIK